MTSMFTGKRVAKNNSVLCWMSRRKRPDKRAERRPRRDDQAEPGQLPLPPRPVGEPARSHSGPPARPGSAGPQDSHSGPLARPGSTSSQEPRGPLLGSDSAERLPEPAGGSPSVQLSGLAWLLAGKRAGPLRAQGRRRRGSAAARGCWAAAPTRPEAPRDSSRRSPWSHRSGGKAAAGREPRTE